MDFRAAASATALAQSSVAFAAASVAVDLVSEPSTGAGMAPASPTPRTCRAHGRPENAVLNRDYGTMYGAYRPAEADSYYWRIAHFVFPFFTFTPPGPLGAKVSASCWVPIDDEHTHQIGFRKPVPGLVGGSRGDMLPRTSSPYRRYRWVANKDNGYLIDRDVQRGNVGPDGYTGSRVC